MNVAEAGRYATALRDLGIERAARNREQRIKAGELVMLRTIRAKADRTVTMDDVFFDGDQKCNDGGKWRGSIPRRLVTAGLIEKSGVCQSERPLHHRGYCTIWKGSDDAKIDDYIGKLEQWLAANPAPSEQTEATDRTLFND